MFEVDTSIGSLTDLNSYRARSEGILETATKRTAWHWQSLDLTLRLMAPNIILRNHGFQCYL